MKILPGLLLFHANRLNSSPGRGSPLLLVTVTHFFAALNAVLIANELLE